jgi:hypothetical protein
MPNEDSKKKSFKVMTLQNITMALQGLFMNFSQKAFC